MAVQGGLLASTIAAREEADLEIKEKKKHNAGPVLAFLTTKLAAYLGLGFILGAFGGALQISDNIRILIQLAAGLYMLAVAGNLLNLHPIFRYVIIQPPRLLTKLVRNQAKSRDLFAPAFLGALTIFIPCGTTLAMEALAISSGSPLLGAAILGAFVLGTSPLFFILGYVTTFLGDAFQKKFLKVAAILVIYLGITSANGALIQAGSSLTLQTLAEAIPLEVNLEGEGDTPPAEQDLARLENGVQVTDIAVERYGYNPNYLKVKKGIPVRLNLTSNDVYSCALAFRIPSLGIKKNLQPTDKATVEFTPQQEGKLVYTCAMGMYSGVVEVVN